MDQMMVSITTICVNAASFNYIFGFSEREMVNLIPNSDMTKGDAPSPAIKYRSVRKYFGKHEQIYIMDAKKSGNLGRYFNVKISTHCFYEHSE